VVGRVLYSRVGIYCSTGITWKQGNAWKYLGTKKAVIAPIPLRPNPQSNPDQAQEDKNTLGQLPLGLLDYGIGFLECWIIGTLQKVNKVL